MLRLALYSVLGFFCGATVGTILVAFTDTAAKSGTRDFAIILLLGVFVASLGVLFARRLNAKDSRQTVATSSEQVTLSNYEVARIIVSYFWTFAFVVFGGLFLFLLFVPRSTGNAVFDWLSVNLFSLEFAIYVSLFAVFAIWVAVRGIVRRKRLSQSNSPDKIACIVDLLVLTSLLLFSLSEGPALLITAVHDPARILLDAAVVASTVATATWYFIRQPQRGLDRLSSH